MNLGTLTGAMNLPMVERLRAVHRKTRPGTRERVTDALPGIAAKYSSSNIMDIVRDPQFLALLKCGAS